MKKLHLKLILLTAVLAVLAFSQTVTAATLDLTDDEYDLYIDEYPDEISECVYAKFSKSKSDVDDYYINLSYDDGSDNFENSLNKSGIRLSDNELMCSFTPSLWYVDPDGEADDRKKTDSIVLYCPLPDEAQQHPADCTAYSVASGKAKKLGTPFETNSDDVVYVKLELPPYSTIGFVYRSEDSYEDEDDSDEDSDEPDEPDEPDNDDGDDGFDDPGSDDDPDNDGEEDDDDPDDDGDEEPDPDDEDTDESFRDNDEDFYYDDDEYFYDDGHGTVNDSVYKATAALKSKKWIAENRTMRGQDLYGFNVLPVGWCDIEYLDEEAGDAFLDGKTDEEPLKGFVCHENENYASFAVFKVKSEMLRFRSDSPDALYLQWSGEAVSVRCIKND